MKKINGGATIWARKTIESDIFFWKPDKWFKIWFFIVNKVNHKNTKLFVKGSTFTTYAEISQYTKATKNQIDSFMRWAKEQSMLTTRKTTRGMTVTVLKYELYQDLSNYKNDTETETKPKQNRNITDTINNNDNNDKNDKNIATSNNVAPINQIFDIFYKSINPTINYGNKTSRKAAEYLINKLGPDKTIKLTEYACSVQGKKYAPTITTPYQLKEKLSQLKIYKEKQDLSNPIII